MPLFDQSALKLGNIRSTILRVLDGDFPFEAGQRALRRMLRVFDDLESKLKRAEKVRDNDTTRVVAGNINLKIYQALPIIGFIIRSTNVRNAFELLEPFQAISDKILQGSPRLLMSSEWDYVPFAYPQSLEDLTGFVLIGMPASEASNALLSPLAAHELGHAVWKNRGIAGAVITTLQINCENLYKDHMPRFRDIFTDYDENNMIFREILPDSISLSTDYAAYHAEELFCDMFAYGVFGISYLYAFGYILAPGLGRRASARYPTHRTRIETLRSIARDEGVTLPTFADLALVDQNRAGFPREGFIIEMAELSVEIITKALWEQVENILRQSKVVRPASVISRQHLEEFRLGVPACNPKSVGDIANAGWQLYKEDIVPQNTRGLADDRLQGLNELMFKTFEVLEFTRRLIDGVKR